MSISLAALAAGGELLAEYIGRKKSAEENNGALDDLRALQKEEDTRYRRLLNREYVDSPENAGLLRRLQDMQRERYNQARATNMVAGGTDAHLASMQSAGGKVVSDTAGSIAERSQAYKDKVDDARMATRRAYGQQMFGLRQQKAQSIANAAGQVSKAMAGIAGALGSVENPFGMFGLSQGDYERLAQANIDATTEASVAAQLENSLNETLNDLKKQGY